MTPNNDVVEPVETNPSGVPMGGVGAGCVEMGRDGRFRNITINNNRTVADRIDVAPGSFLAVRACMKGKVSTRILQPDSSAAFETANVIPSYTPWEQLSWRGLYPCSHYHLDDPRFPLDVAWSAMAPIIPFDTEASTLPMLFLAFQITNPGDTPVDVSTVINWENLCGCVRDRFPEQRGPIQPAFLRREEDSQPEDADQPEAPRRPAGLFYGLTDGFRDNAVGNYCLVAKPQSDVDISIKAWDERNPDDVIAFWEEFHDQGRLNNDTTVADARHSGAVCCAFAVPPKGSRRVIYTLTWYCPRFEVKGVDYGNGYTNRFHNAKQIAEVGIKHHKYFLNSAEAWQKRIFSSTLPRWFCKMLINNSCIFSTNTIYTKDERFAVFETPEDPAVGALDRNLYSSLATLLFYPDFAHRELLQFAITRDPAQPGRVYRDLGSLCTHQPRHGGDAEHLQMDINPAFILLAYRNYCMTGNLVILRNTWPRIKDIFAYALSLDRDGDGLPESDEGSTAFKGWPERGVGAYSSSLWLAALRAYAKLATAVGQKEEAKNANTILAKAVETFDERLWDPERGHYRMYSAPPPAGAPDQGQACCSAQLAGQWYSDFLCLGHLLPDERIESTLRVMSKTLEGNSGVAFARMPEDAANPTPSQLDADAASKTTWPSLYAGHYSSLLIHHGKTDRGLYTVQKVYQNLHVTRNLPFNQPFAWNLDDNAPEGWGADRYMGSSSIWHVLYALEGFHLNLPEKTLWIRPNLPKNVHNLSAPLFTPSCFGWLKYEEELVKGYAQNIELSFDSPVHAKVFVVRIPSWVKDVTVQCASGSDDEPTRHMLGFDGSDHLVEIQPLRPIVVGQSLLLTITGTRFGPRPVS